MIRVLVADDHPIMREGICAVISSQPDMQMAGEANNGAEAVALYRTLQPDVALIDLQMPDMNGIEAIRTICTEFPHARIAILTTYQGDVRVLHAIKAGAKAYLLKSALRKELTEAIRALAAGKRYFPADIATEIAQFVDQDKLSEREIQILRHIASGKANKQIAVELNIAEDTVKGHLKNIMDKLGANNRTHAVTIGISRGIIEI